MPPPVLIHYTNKMDSLLSILRYGFLFTEHSNGVLDAVARRRIVKGQGASMVCFCEPSAANIEKFFHAFGKFGIAVDCRAFADKELKAVRYLDPLGDRVLQLARLFERLAPPHRGVLSDDGDQFESRLQSMLISSGEELSGFAVSARWLRFIHALRFCETSTHSWEREWRLRGNSSSLMSASANPEEDLRFRRDILQRTVDRCRQRGTTEPSDLVLLKSLAFFVPARLIKWLEVHPAKASVVKRRLQELQVQLNAPYGAIEVRSIGLASRR